MLEKLKEHLEKYYDSTYKKWVVLFPEGGFLRKRRKGSQEYVFNVILYYFYIPRAFSFCPVSVCDKMCAIVCGKKKINLGHNFLTVRDKNFIFGMHTRVIKHFQMKPRSMTLSL